MNPATQHAHEDRLLELAYGELAPADAAAVQHHLQGCERCSDALASIRGVRTAMAPLAEEAAPVEGLESLLAYAEQAARRNAGTARSAAPWWRRWSVALSTACALGLVVMVAQRGLEQGAPVSTDAAKRNERAEATPKAEPLAQAAPEAPAAGLQPVDEGTGDGREKEQVERDARRLAEARPEASSAAVEQKLRKREAAKSLTFGDASSRADWSNAGAGQLAEVSKGGEGVAAKPGAPAPSKLATKLPEAPMGRGRASGGIGAAELERVGDVSPAPKVAAAREDPAASPAEPMAASSSPARKSKAAAPAVPPPVVEDLKLLLRQASEARAQGDRPREAILLQRALAAGATGSLRAELLSRSCEVEDLLGRTSRADAVCTRLLQEFPGSSAAAVAQRRQARQLSEEAGEQPAGQKQ